MFHDKMLFIKAFYKGFLYEPSANNKDFDVITLYNDNDSGNRNNKFNIIFKRDEYNDLDVTAFFPTHELITGKEFSIFQLNDLLVIFHQHDFLQLDFIKGKRGRDNSLEFRFYNLYDVTFYNGDLSVEPYDENEGFSDLDDLSLDE